MNTYPGRCQICALPTLDDLSKAKQNWLLTYLCLGLYCSEPLLRSIAAHSVRKHVHQLHEHIEVLKRNLTLTVVAEYCTTFYNNDVRPLLWDNTPITVKQFEVCLAQHRLSKDRQAALTLNHLDLLQMNMYSVRDDGIRERLDIYKAYLKANLHHH